MLETVYLTNTENQSDASTLAYQTGGLVLVVGSTAISNKTETCEVWTITPTTWKQNSKSHFTSYCEIEDILARTEIFYKTSFVSKESFVLCMPEIISQTYSKIINFIAETLAENKEFNVIIF